MAEFKDIADLRARIIASLQKLREPRPASLPYVSDIPAPPEVYVTHPYKLLQTGRLIGRQPELNCLTDWGAGSSSQASPPGSRSRKTSDLSVGDMRSNDARLNSCEFSYEEELRRRCHNSRMFFLVAIGGQGKSALTWHWFQTIAEQEIKPLAGRIWWSFYESDASFENFVTRTLAYVSGEPLDEFRKLPAFEREDWLLRVLDHEPYLLVLD